MTSGHPFKVAVYGKGGIGKSTVSANISYELASRGYRVLQVGCDPKHDSTRLLLKGEAQPTILYTIRIKDDVQREDVVRVGSLGVECAEAGGPRPGIGCAGRGVITAVDTLDSLGVGRDSDFIIYDVLGDVVCGGFAVPMRGDNTDAVIIVTSGEFMSLYAANNIMKGLRNFDSGRGRLLGLVFNSRGDDDGRMVELLSEGTGTEIIARIPRSKDFADAESRGMTLMECHPDSPGSDSIRSIVDRIVDASASGEGMCTPRPLDDEQISRLASGLQVIGTDRITEQQCPGHCFNGRNVVASCATHGALAVLNRIKDIAVLIHGPSSCAFLMGYAQNREYMNGRGSRIYGTTPFSGNVFSTGMDGSDSIFGGTLVLESKLRELADRGYPAIAVISSCVTGIIGDDTRNTVARIDSEYPNCRMFTVEADGNISGNKFSGYNKVSEALLDLVDKNVEKRKGYVNILCDTFKKANRPDYNRLITTLLDIFHLKVNTSMVDVCLLEDIRRLPSAELNLRLYDNEETDLISHLLEERFGMETARSIIPVGTSETVSWIDEMAEKFDMEEEARRAKEMMDASRKDGISQYGHLFEGERVLVSVLDPVNLRWISEVLGEVGMEILPIPGRSELNHHQDEDFFRINAGAEEVRAMAERLEPDVVVTDRNIRDLGFPRIRLDRSMFDVFRYGDSLRRMWLQMVAPAKAGWMEVSP